MEAQSNQCVSYPRTVNANMQNNTNSNNNENPMQKKELIKPKIKFNLLIEDYFIIEKVLQFFSVIACPYVKDFSAVLMNFTKNGIQAKYGFSLDQQAIKHFDDLKKMEEFPYVIFEFNYKFFSAEQNNQDNVIRKSFQRIDLTNNKLIQERLPVNHDILPIAVDLNDYIEFAKNIENSKPSENAYLNFKIKTKKDEEEGKPKNFLEIVSFKNNSIVTKYLPVIIHGMSEPFPKFKSNYLLKIKNFPAKYFLETFVTYIEQLQDEQDLKASKFLGCIKNVNRLNKDFISMSLKFKTGCLEFSLNPENIEDFGAYEHLQKYFIFRKHFFLGFGRMLKKIKNYENYVIDWEFSRNTTYVESNKEVEYHVLSLNLKSIDDIEGEGNHDEFGNNNYYSGSWRPERDGKIKISSSILYLQFDPNEGDVSRFMEDLD